LKTAHKVRKVRTDGADGCIYGCGAGFGSYVCRGGSGNDGQRRGGNDLGLLFGWFGASAFAFTGAAAATTATGAATTSVVSDFLTRGMLSVGLVWVIHYYNTIYLSILTQNIIKSLIIFVTTVDDIIYCSTIFFLKARKKKHR